MPQHHTSLDIGSWKWATLFDYIIQSVRLYVFLSFLSYSTLYVTTEHLFGNTQVHSSYLVRPLVVIASLISLGVGFLFSFYDAVVEYNATCKACHRIKMAVIDIKSQREGQRWRAAEGPPSAGTTTRKFLVGQQTWTHNGGASEDKKKSANVVLSTNTIVHGALERFSFYLYVIV